MAKRTTRTRTTTTRSWLKFFSYLAVMLLGLGIAISVLLGKLLPDIENVARLIKNIAIAIALPIPMFLSYYEARRKSTVWFVLWVIAVILIVVFYVLGIVWKI